MDCGVNGNVRGGDLLKILVMRFLKLWLQTRDTLLLQLFPLVL